MPWFIVHDTVIIMHDCRNSPHCFVVHIIFLVIIDLRQIKSYLKYVVTIFS